MDLDDVLPTRLLLVTGKGGVGKSTVAAALAVAAARMGRRTCLVEVEGRQTMARLFSTQPWDFTEWEFRPDLFGMSIDPEASLVEYLDMFYGARRLSRLVVGSTAVEFATAAAPGLKDVLLIGKVREMERRRDPDGRFHYDLIVVDAPPTGRIVNFLRAPDATTELIRVGPIRNQAQSLVEMLTDPGRTCLTLVALLEEMPVQETLDSAAALRALGVRVGATIINRVVADPFDDETRTAVTKELGPHEIALLLDRADVDGDGAEIALALHALGERRLTRLALQERMRDELHASAQGPVLELPYIPGESFGEDELRRLAAVIEALDA